MEIADVTVLFDVKLIQRHVLAILLLLNVSVSRTEPFFLVHRRVCPCTQPTSLTTSCSLLTPRTDSNVRDAVFKQRAMGGVSR